MINPLSGREVAPFHYREGPYQVGYDGRGLYNPDTHVERKFRETRLYQVAPISTNLILSHVATHVLGLPKSF